MSLTRGLVGESRLTLATLLVKWKREVQSGQGRAGRGTRAEPKKRQGQGSQGSLCRVSLRWPELGLEERIQAVWEHVLAQQQEQSKSLGLSRGRAGGSRTDIEGGI